MDIELSIANLDFHYHFTSEIADEKSLSANEKRIAEKFSSKRLDHFCTGRYCAKTALQKIKKDSFEILSGPDGEPLWPETFIGSISHAEGLVGAIVSDSRELHSLGIDIEKLGRVNRKMWDSIFTRSEQKFLESLKEEELEFYTTLYFSIKESFYKLQYPLSSLKIWFTDIEISSSINGYSIMVINKEPKGINFNSLAIQYVQYHNFIIAICSLTRPY